MNWFHVGFSLWILICWKLLSSLMVSVVFHKHNAKNVSRGRSKTITIRPWKQQGDESSRSWKLRSMRSSLEIGSLFSDVSFIYWNMKASHRGYERRMSEIPKPIWPWHRRPCEVSISLTTKLKPTNQTSRNRLEKLPKGKSSNLETADTSWFSFCLRSSITFCFSSIVLSFSSWVWRRSFINLLEGNSGHKLVQLLSQIVNNLLLLLDRSFVLFLGLEEVVYQSDGRDFVSWGNWFQVKIQFWNSKSLHDVLI